MWFGHRAMALLAERDMGERLGEVAELSTADGVVLLGEKADIVSQTQQALVERGGLGVAAHQGQAVNEPE